MISTLRHLENAVWRRLVLIEAFYPAQLDAELRTEYLRCGKLLDTIDRLKASIEAAHPETMFH